MRRFQVGTGFNPSPLRLVYTRCFSSRTTSKSGDHGALACRPRKTSYGSGNTPSRAEAAPSGPAKKRDRTTWSGIKPLHVHCAPIAKELFVRRREPGDQ